jgi:hypothetical protein
MVHIKLLNLSVSSVYHSRVLSKFRKEITLRSCQCRKSSGMTLSSTAMSHLSLTLCLCSSCTSLLVITYLHLCNSAASMKPYWKGVQNNARDLLLHNRQREVYFGWQLSWSPFQHAPTHRIDVVVTKHRTRDLTFTRCKVIIITIRRLWDLEDDAVSRIKLQWRVHTYVKKNLKMPWDECHGLPVLMVPASFSWSISTSESSSLSSSSQSRFPHKNPCSHVVASRMAMGGWKWTETQKAVRMSLLWNLVLK